MQAAMSKKTLPEFESDLQDSRWQAILARDKKASGFVYAVLTTGIYCRSGCPSRRPNIENVSFFDTPESARNAGFRACKRCQPDDHILSASERIAQACQSMRNAEVAPALKELAAQAQMSPNHFHRTFKAITGTTPKAYARWHKTQKLQDKLQQSDTTVTQAIFNAGFNSVSRFYEQATSLLGMSASRYQKGGADEKILFAVGECSLGSLLVACTVKGVCALLLGDDPDALLDDLQTRFPKAELVGGDTHFEALVARVVGYVNQPQQSLDLPLDIQGTAFQERVWSALMKIPPGSTASYAQIAADIGAAGAHRAVASACGRNKLAVVIPCHRVVRSDGGLSGYRWGIDRKRQLLDMEQQLHNG